MKQSLKQKNGFKISWNQLKINLIFHKKTGFNSVFFIYNLALFCYTIQHKLTSYKGLHLIISKYIGNPQNIKLIQIK